MSGYEVALIPVQGNPIVKVWLPKNRQLTGLLAEWYPGDSDALRQARRLAGSWGVPASITWIGRKGRVVVCICWIAPGTALAGLEEVPVDVALRDATFGPLVAAAREELRSGKS